MKSAVLLSLGALALAAPTQETRSQGTTIAYNRKQYQARDDSEDYTHFFKSLRTIVQKYNTDIQLPDAIQNAGLQKRSSNEPLVDNVEQDVDEDYYGTGSIRSTTFTFDFDTGSSDTFVPGPSCGSTEGCVGSTKYDQKGTDEHNTTSVTYGSGQVTGENYFDSLTVAGLTATHQNVISLTEAMGFTDLGADGLMGMGFQSIANSGQPPFWTSLYNEGKLSPSEFSFYLGRARSNTGGNSEMTLAGRDSSKYTGSFTNIPVTKQGYWQVAVTGIAAGENAPSGLSGGQAAIDTGTTLLLAPTLAITDLITQINGAMAIPIGADMTAIGYPCSEKPSVYLQFGGSSKKFAVNDLDFELQTLSSALGVQLADDPLTDLLDEVLGLLGGSSSDPSASTDYCLSSVVGADLGATQLEELYVVGDAFLKNWYSTFHYDSPSSAYVAFAKAV